MVASSMAASSRTSRGRPAAICSLMPRPFDAIRLVMLSVALTHCKWSRQEELAEVSTKRSSSGNLTYAVCWPATPVRTVAPGSPVNKGWLGHHGDGRRARWT